jgi:hypothetical protein
VTVKPIELMPLGGCQDCTRQKFYRLLGLPSLRHDASSLGRDRRARHKVISRYLALRGPLA